MLMRDRLHIWCNPLFLSILTGILFFLVVSPGSCLYEVGSLHNGPSFDMVESDGMIYVAQGGEIRVYDISSPSHVAQLTWRDYLSKIVIGSPIQSVAHEGTTLFVAADDCLAIVDVSSPQSPRLISTYANPHPGTNLREVTLFNDYAYLSVYNKGIQVVDISDFTNPRTVRNVPLGGYDRPRRSCIDGHYLYVAMETDHRLVVLDIADPSMPVILGSYTSGEDMQSFSAVAVKDGYAFVTEYHNGMHVIDVSEPAHPRLVSSLMGMDANDIKILGDNAYISVRYQGFTIVDISDPAHLSITEGIFEHSIAGYVEGIHVNADYVFIAASTLGFGIFDNSGFFSPSLIVKIPVVGGVDSLQVKGTMLYMGAHNDGIWIVDVSDPKNPVESAYIHNGGRNDGLDIDGTSLYVAGEWSGFTSVDITNPDNPGIRITNFDDNINAVAGNGDVVYTSAGIISVLDPENPVYISKDPLFNGNLELFGDNHLAVAAYRGEHPGLHLFDVSDPSHPEKITTVLDGSPVRDIAIRENTGVALSGNDVIAIDLTNPQTPVILKRISYQGTWIGQSICISDKTVYASGGPYGHIKVFDISKPATMECIDEMELPGTPYTTIYSDGRYIYTGNTGGVHILSPEKSDMVHNPQQEPVASESHGYLSDNCGDCGTVASLSSGALKFLFLLLGVLVVVTLNDWRRREK